MYSPRRTFPKSHGGWYRTIARLGGGVFVLACSGGCGGKSEADDGACIDQPNCAGQRWEAISVAAGEQHACAVIRTGGVKCWGANHRGQLGDGSNTDRSTPVDVHGLTSGAVAVAVGEHYTCALTGAGSVKCWGSVSLDEIGDVSTPVDVVELGSDVRAIAAGNQHTCALTGPGGVMCWGSNQYGQLGDGTENNVRREPVAVSGLPSDVVAISAGWAHTCALTNAGAVKCWGHGGRLGDGTETTKTVPTDVVGLGSGALALSAGRDHSCAVTESGSLECWGFNAFGQLGDGTDIDKTTPTTATGLSPDTIAVDGGTLHTCALTGSGGVECWGDNSWGALGDGSQVTKFEPTIVRDLASNVVAISAGTGFTCAVTYAGLLQCWGRNASGQLGDGTGTDRTSPGMVAGF